MNDSSITQFKDLTAACIGCGSCTSVCNFLSKYNLKLSDTDRLYELAYHCYLCGECDRVCPAHISGKNTILKMRRSLTSENNDSVPGGIASGVINEKMHYKFMNYRHAMGDTAFFPGCNFLSLYPKTSHALSAMFQGLGIGTVHDCCGKPIGEAGLEKEERRIINDLRLRLESRGITKIIVACPNCYYYLRSLLCDVEIANIYDVLSELAAQGRIQLPSELASQARIQTLPELASQGKIQLSHACGSLEEGASDVLHDEGAKDHASGYVEGDSDSLDLVSHPFYIPCPDRDTHEWLKSIEKLMGFSARSLDGPQCCGLGGLAASSEPALTKELAASMKRWRGAGQATDADTMPTHDIDTGQAPDADTKRMRGAGDSCIFTYCASCVGQFARNKVTDVVHILPLILGTNERPDILKSYVNRAINRFR